MRPRIYRFALVQVTPAGNFRSLPTEVGSAFPQVPVASPRPMEHPQVMTTTVEVGIPPLEPANDSTLATGHHPELPPAPVEVPSA